MPKRKTVSNDNDNDPSSWTSSKLKTELQNLGINISVTLSRKNLVSLYKDNVPKDNSLQSRTPLNSVQDIHENSNIDSVSADFISNQSERIVEKLINTSNIQEVAVGNGQRTSAHVSQPTPLCTEQASASQGSLVVSASSSNMEQTMMATLQLCPKTIKQASNGQPKPSQLHQSSAGYNLQLAMFAK